MKVLIAAGGSGGHIFPAIALAKSLQKEAGGTDVRFVGSDKALDRRIFEKEGFKFSILSANKFPYRRSPFEFIAFLIRLKIDLIRALFIILSYKPDVVAGFGGYVSFPVVMIAWLFRIPKIVHEQNVTPGRANRILFKLADRVAVSFEKTRSGKSVFTGNPIRDEVLKEDSSAGMRRFGFDGSKFTILVIGGSQGAHFLNEAFIGALAGMDKKLRGSFQVIHLTGVKDYEWAVKAYSALEGLESRVHSFIDRIEEAYSASNLIITRAGASAIFEAAYFARPMILVPYPFAAAHQAENADVFARGGGAIVIAEKTLSAEVFKAIILKLSADKEALKSLGAAAKLLSVPDASVRLAREVLMLRHGLSINPQAKSKGLNLSER